MFLALLAVVPVLLQSPAATQPARESLPVQFVLRNETMKQHATVVDNQLTITAGADEPYLSSITVGAFEASGEIAMPANSRATLQLFATVEPDAAAHPRVEVPLPPTSDDGWQPMTVSSLGGHVRVVIAGRVIAEREVEGEPVGLFGFDVSTGQLSLRSWRVVRHDVSPAPSPADSSVLDARRLPPGAQVPRLAHEVKPRYTEGAMRRKVQGVVAVEAVVEVDGSVRPLRVTKSLDEELDAQAIEAVKQWRFEPALVDGRPVPCQVTIELTFVLRGR